MNVMDIIFQSFWTLWCPTGSGPYGGPNVQCGKIYFHCMEKSSLHILIHISFRVPWGKSHTSLTDDDSLKWMNMWSDWSDQILDMRFSFFLSLCISFFLASCIQNPLSSTIWWGMTDWPWYLPDEMKHYSNCLQNREIKLKHMYGLQNKCRCRLTCSTCSCSLGERVMATSSLFKVPVGFSILGSDLGFRLKKLRKLRDCDCCLGLFIVQSWTVQPKQHERIGPLLIVCLCLLLMARHWTLAKRPLWESTKTVHNRVPWSRSSLFSSQINVFCSFSYPKAPHMFIPKKT